jgi:hypothetical protein
MDAASGSTAFAELARIRWDTPYRMLASILGISTWVSWVEGRRPFEVLEGGAAWLHADALANWIAGVDAWALEQIREPVSVFLGLVAAACLIFNYAGGIVIDESRAPATLWVVLTFLAYDWVLGPWWSIALYVAAIVVLIALLHWDGKGPLRIGAWEWLGVTFANVFVAGLWVFFAVMLWVLVPDRRKTVPSR